MSNRFLVAVDDAMRIWNSFLFDQSPCARLAEFAATTGSLTSEMAPRAGFEPATNRLTGERLPPSSPCNSLRATSLCT
jgi:hypothetical protein